MTNYPDGHRTTSVVTFTDMAGIFSRITLCEVLRVFCSFLI